MGLHVLAFEFILSSEHVPPGQLMTIHDGTSAEWTVSRIMRLLRPLKNKCSALSSYIKEHPADFGGQHLGEDQALLPLENPSKIGLRIHFNRDTVQAFELSKRVYAIRDCFHDLLSRAIGQQMKFSILSLADLCSVILGAQIPREEAFAARDTPDTVEILYEEIPPRYRLSVLRSSPCFRFILPRPLQSNTHDACIAHNTGNLS